ncbi:MAG TPA: LysE family transporter [Kaistia sp.]|nr:LysE family transporter [Kaistia sp.]
MADLSLETLPSFAVAALVLLAVPGPTNALLAAAGASDLRSAWQLIPLAIVGYGLSISALTMLLGEATDAYPALGSALRLAAGAWLIWSAVRLWYRGAASGDDMVTRGRFLVTTMLNPKTLVFASAIFPAAAAAGAFWPAIIFSACTAATSASWIMIGKLLASRAGQKVNPRLVGRVAALTLAGFAVWVMGWGLAGLIR